MDLKFITPYKLRAPKNLRYKSAPYPNKDQRNTYMVSTSKKLGRGTPGISKLYNDKCSCHREKVMVFCRSCGYHIQNSRVALPCVIHPRVSII